MFVECSHSGFKDGVQYPCFQAILTIQTFAKVHDQTHKIQENFYLEDPFLALY